MIIRPLRIGDMLADPLSEPQFGGAFGQLLRGAVRVEAIGADWVVARTENGTPRFADVDPEDLVPWRESRGGAFPGDLP